MNKLLVEIFRIVESYTNLLLKRIVKLLLIISVGLAALAAGSIFLLVSFIFYLSQFLPLWMAVGLNGVLALGAGGALLVVFRQQATVRRRRSGTRNDADEGRDNRSALRDLEDRGEPR